MSEHIIGEKRPYPEESLIMSKFTDRAVCVTKYGTLFFHTVSNQPNHESPQDAAFKHAKENGFQFYVCSESQSTKDSKKQYKSYGAYRDIKHYIDCMPTSATSQDNYHFYEIWHQSLPGVLSFDIEWEIFEKSALQEEHTAQLLVDVHNYIINSVCEIMKWGDDVKTEIALPMISSDSRPSECSDTNTPYFKESFHFYYKDILVQSNHTVSLAFYDLIAYAMARIDRFKFKTTKGEVKQIIDFNVATKNRAFRLAYSSKAKGGRVNSYMKPISNEFLSQNSAVGFSRSELAPPPWDSKGDDRWKYYMEMLTSSSLSGWTPRFELVLDNITSAMSRMGLENMHMARLAQRRQILDSLNPNAVVKPLKQFKFTSESGAVKTFGYRGYGSGAENSNGSAADSVQNEPDEIERVPMIDDDEGAKFVAHHKYYLSKAAQTACDGLNKFDGSFGASVVTVFPNGVFLFSSTSNACVYKSGNPNRPANHTSNHIRFTGRLEYPCPVIYYSCCDKDDCVDKKMLEMGKIRVPIPPEYWFNTNYVDMIQKYCEDQSILEETINLFF